MNLNGLMANFKWFERLVLSIFLTFGLPFEAHAETALEIRARAEKMLLEIPNQISSGPDLRCSSSQVFFKYYKMQYDGFESSAGLCVLVDAYADHLANNVLRFWPLKDNFGMVVRPISKIEEYNAAFVARPIINKNSVPNLLLFYLPEAPVSPQKAVWSHEVGHAALQEILDEHFFPQAKEGFIKKVENVTRRTSGERQLDILRNQLDDIRENWSKLNAAEREKTKKKRDVLNYRRMSLDNKLQPKDPTMSLILTSFHEFFADLFAADLHQDLNVVGNSFDELGIKSSPSDFRRFDPKSAVSFKGWTYFEPHILLTPARHYFGKNLSSKIKDKKRFLRELSNYFIKVLENPDTGEFLSYNPIIADVEKSESADAVTAAFDSRFKKSELFSIILTKEIKNFCELDLRACKSELIEQLRRGQSGIFLTNANPEIANRNLIGAMEAIVKNIE